MNRRDLLKTGIAGTAFALSAGNLAAQTTGANIRTEGIQRLRVGKITVTALSDGFADFITPQTKILQGITTETYEKTIEASGRGAGARQTDVNAYLVENGERLTLIDAGTNKGFAPTLGRTQDALLAAGYVPEQITDILITHMHPDHSGGLIGPDGGAFYPNANLLIHELEHEYWVNGDAGSRNRPDMEAQFQLAKTATAIYGNRVSLFRGEEIGLPGITTVPLFGHTPGHVGCMIESDGDRVFVVSDIIHQSVIQFAFPETTVTFDVDQDEARKTRIRALDRIATDGERIIGMHLPFPGAGKVERHGDGYRWVAEEREYF
ncbi:MAG: MBL fold metallo-hydrolase [Pseudomonadota bacterium]